jgi:hypothetical protein
MFAGSLALRWIGGSAPLPATPGGAALFGVTVLWPRCGVISTLLAIVLRLPRLWP